MFARYYRFLAWLFPRRPPALLEGVRRPGSHQGAAGAGSWAGPETGVAETARRLHFEGGPYRLCSFSAWVATRGVLDGGIGRMLVVG